MKKILFIAISVAATTLAKSQTYIQGGVNLANITQTANGQTEKNNMLTTFNVGLLSRFGISHTIDLESGVIYSGRGSKAETYYTSTTNDNYVKTKFNPFYIEVPLNLVVRIPLPSKLNLFVYGGPYASMGVAGKSTSESKIFGVSGSSEQNIKFANDNPFTSRQDDAAYNKLKRFDFGLNAGAGLDLRKVILKVNYGYGFTKINSTEGNNSVDDKNKYRTVSVSLGIPLSR